MHQDRITVLLPVDYTQKIKFTWLLPFTGSAWRAEGKKPLPLLTWTEAALFSLNYILCLPLYKAYPWLRICGIKSEAVGERMKAADFWPLIVPKAKAAWGFWLYPTFCRQEEGEVWFLHLRKIPFSAPFCPSIRWFSPYKGAPISGPTIVFSWLLWRNSRTS